MIRATRIPGYLTIAETAEKLGVSHSQAARYIRLGDLEAIDIGGQRLVKESAVKRFRKPPRGNPNFLKCRKSKRR